MAQIMKRYIRYIILEDDGSVGEENRDNGNGSEEDIEDVNSGYNREEDR